MISPAQEKLRVRFIQTASTERECYISGKEYDLPQVDGQNYIRCNLAIAVVEAAEMPTLTKEATKEPKAKADKPAAKKGE